MWPKNLALQPGRGVFRVSTETRVGLGLGADMKEAAWAFSANHQNLGAAVRTSVLRYESKRPRRLPNDRSAIFRLKDHQLPCPARLELNLQGDYDYELVINYEHNDEHIFFPPYTPSKHSC